MPKQKTWLATLIPSGETTDFLTGNENRPSAFTTQYLALCVCFLPYGKAMIEPARKVWSHRKFKSI